MPSEIKMQGSETAESIESIANEVGEPAMNESVTKEIGSTVLSVLEVAANRIATDPILAKSVEIDGVNETTIIVTISLPEGVEPNTSAATTLNAMALRVISKLSIPTDEDVECSLSSCIMRPLQTQEGGKIVLPLEVTFSLPQQGVE
jgi:hypothetical protein